MHLNTIKYRHHLNSSDYKEINCDSEQIDDPIEFVLIRQYCLTFTTKMDYKLTTKLNVN